jgi:hypothetical protein
MRVLTTPVQARGAAGHQPGAGVSFMLCPPG